MKYDLWMNGRCTSKKLERSGIYDPGVDHRIGRPGHPYYDCHPQFSADRHQWKSQDRRQRPDSDFNALREKAMAGDSPCLRPLTGECFDLTFDAANNRYTVNPASGLPNGGKSPASVASDIHLTAATSPITFLTRGALSQGGNVVLKNSRASTATITFNQSGRTYVQFNMQ